MIPEHHSPPGPPTRRLGRVVVAALLTASCLASPPREVHAGNGFRVRADDQEEAQLVARLVEGLREQILNTLPDSHFPEQLEVWVQDRPHLYAIPLMGASEAEGLWAEDRARILLARDADDVERTLAHELTHAVLGSSWHELPGSLEEGFCDAIAARLCPDGAARLRAGRLSSAALALGGLELTLELSGKGRLGEAAQSIRARIVLSGEEAALEGEEHLGVFRLQAGLSSTRIEASAKRSFYGLSFLIVERVVERVGIAGLHSMCVAAEERNLSQIPYTELLEAAELGSGRQDWWLAALARLGREELVEIVRMYPGFVLDTLEGHLVARSLGEDAVDDPDAWRERAWQRLDGLSAMLSLHESGARVDVTQLGFIQRALEDRIEQYLDRVSRTQVASAE